MPFMRAFLWEYEHFHIPILKYGNSERDIVYLIHSLSYKACFTLLRGEVPREVFYKNEIYFDYSLRKKILYKETSLH